MGAPRRDEVRRLSFLNAISTLDRLRTPFLEGGAHRDMLPVQLI